MKLVKLENNAGVVVAESDNIESLSKLASADPKLKLLKDFPLNGFKILNGEMIEMSISEKVQSGILDIEDLRAQARNKIRSEIDSNLEIATTTSGYKVDRYSREKAMTSLNLIATGKSNLAFYTEAQCLEMLSYLKMIDSCSTNAMQEIESTNNPERLMSISFQEFLPH